MPSKAELETRVRQDYQKYLGKTIWVRWVNPIVDFDNKEFIFDPPIACTVVETPEDELLIWRDGWVDPYWWIEPIAGREAHGFPDDCLLWADGISYSVTGEVEIPAWQKLPANNPDPAMPLIIP